MNIHKNARLSFHGRVLLVKRIIDEHWKIAEAAEAAGTSARTASKWLARFRAGGERMLHDRSSAPARPKHKLSAETVAAIEVLRRQRLTGQAIADRLAVPRSTVGNVLRRLGLGRLEAKPPILRYEREKPGELIHIDSKKLGKIDGIGHRITGDRHGQSSKRGIGWEALHVAIDDASRLAYTEIMPDETATHKRQGGALHPDLVARMDLCRALPILSRTDQSHEPLDRWLQYSQSSFSS